MVCGRGRHRSSTSHWSSGESSQSHEVRTTPTESPLAQRSQHSSHGLPMISTSTNATSSPLDQRSTIRSSSNNPENKSGRGMTKLMKSLENPDQRPHHTLDGNNFTHTAVGQISVLIRTHFVEPWTHWRDVPIRVRDAMWSHWLMLWYPIPVDDMPRVREISERHAQARFKSFLERIRKDSMQDAGVSEFDASCINYPPSCMTHSVWQNLCNEWMNPKWKARAKSGRLNRAAIDVIHGGGSRSFSDHLVYMKREKLDATQVDVYKKMYTNKSTGEFRGQHPKRYVETYEAVTRVSQQLQDSETLDESSPTLAPAFNPLAWVEAIGGVHKGRIRGIGSRVKPCEILGDSYSSSSATCSSSVSITGPSYDLFEERLREERLKLKQMEEQMEQQLAAERKKYEDERKKLEEMIAKLMENYPPQDPPSH